MIPGGRRRIIIYGLNNTEKTQCDIKPMICQLMRRMKIKFHPNQIIFVRRLGKKNDTVIKPVIVIFNNTHLKERCLAKSYHLRGSGIRIDVHQPRGLRRRMAYIVKLKKVLRKAGEIRVRARYARIYVQGKKLPKIKVRHLLHKYTPLAQTTLQETLFPGQITTLKMNYGDRKG